MWFEREVDHLCCGGEGILGAEKGEGERDKGREENMGEYTRKIFPQSYWLGKGEEMIFLSSCYQGLED